MVKREEKIAELLSNTGDIALKRRARRIIEEIAPAQNDYVLDAGCGDGFYLHLLSNLNVGKIHLFGVDYDANALKSAKRNLKGKKILIKQGNLMRKLPFKSGVFDKVVMSEVVEHLPDDIKGFKEVKRVLKRNGLLVITVPNHNYPLFWDPVNWILERLSGKHVRKGFWAGIWNQHVRLYKPKEIKRKVVKAGFKVERVESLTFWCLPFNHNLMNYAAIKLHSGKLSHDLKKSMNKYETMAVKRQLIVNLAFWAVNQIDKLNDLWTPEDFGVGVLVVARK